MVPSRSRRRAGGAAEAAPGVGRRARRGNPRGQRAGAAALQGDAMTPVMFEGCAGWLHPAAGNRGVIICAAQGYEELCTHRPMRGLAERFAEAGLPTLRFDYPSTGDSIG